MIKYRIVIQSRLSSSRLPCKGLLPVAGMPSVILCAKRAANRGADVVVATSTDPSDDALVELLQKHAIRFIRGSLDDVLSRYVLAAKDLSENDVIIRLTADNLVPDGSYCDELVHALVNEGLSYLCSGAPQDGLPYGLSAEAFSVNSLRLASDKAESDYDKEHVTPWIWKAYGMNSFRSPKFDKQLASLRCSLDTFEDYQKLIKLFSGVVNPVEIPWQELCEILESNIYKSKLSLLFGTKNNELHSELSLGTAQLGMEYGIANKDGLPSDESASSILRLAIAYGVTSIDCARGYGVAESRVGQTLSGGLGEQVNVITKLDPFADVDFTVAANNISLMVDSSIFRSCRELRHNRLHTLLLHRWHHRHVGNSAIWNRLLELKAEGVIETIGASVQTPAEALEAFADPDVGHVQLPFNLLDRRWKEAGVHVAALNRSDVVVHARSALLQGLLTTTSEMWPSIKGSDSAKYLLTLNTMVKELDREDALDLCFAYVRAQEWITSIVVGMESVTQLDKNIRYFKNSPLTEDECKVVESNFHNIPEGLLDPSKWNHKENSHVTKSTSCLS